MRCAAGEQHLSRQHQPSTPEATGRGTRARQGRDPGSARRSIAAYVGTLPDTGLGLSRLSDHETAHRTAESACFGSNGNQPCRLLAETAERCLAVTRGIMSLGIVVTEDPSTYTLVYHGVGTGATLRQAQRSALADCRSRRAPDMICRIAASRCG